MSHQHRSSLHTTLALALLSASPLLTYCGRANGPKTETAQFVVTGNFADKQDFAHDVLTGLRSASKSAPTLAFATTLIPAGASARQAEGAVLASIAQHSPLAIISADNSSNAAVVLRTADSIGLPVLITVATSDELLQPSSSNTENYNAALRLVARNNLQASAIVDEAETLALLPNTPATASDKATLICLTDGSLYAHNIATAIRAKCHKLRCSTFARDSRNIALNSIARDAKTRYIVCFLGYYQDLPDLLSTLSILNIAWPLILSDGCASPDLGKLALALRPPGSRTFLCQPSQGGDPTTGTAYEAIGVKTGVLITTALAATQPELRNVPLVSAIQRTAVSPDTFGTDGQLGSARFTTTEIK